MAHNAGSFVFSDGTFTEVYPSDSKKKVPKNMYLNGFCNEVGIPEKIKSYRSPYFCRQNSELLKYIKRKVIYLTYAEPEHKNQIVPIDVEISELRKHNHKK